MLKFTKIRSRLFFIYSILIICFISLFTAVFYFYTAKDLRNKALESMSQLSWNISSQVDNELKSMNTISSRMVSSPLLTQLLLNDFFGTGNFDKITIQRRYNDLMLTILAPHFNTYQINLFSLDGVFLSYGKVYDLNKLDREHLNSIKWINNVVDARGSLFLTSPHNSEIKRTDKTVISLCRALSVNLVNMYNVLIEIQLDLTVLNKLVEKAKGSQAEKSVNDLTVYIVDQEGKLIYPCSEENKLSKEYEFFYKKVKSHKGTSNISTSTFNITNPKYNSRGIAAYTYSTFSSWTIILYQKNSVALRPLIIFRNTILAIGLGMLALTTLLSFFIANWLSNPIKRLHKIVNETNIDTLSHKSNPGIKSNIDELENLYSSFVEMRIRLKETMQNVIETKSQEVQAHMLALQSQMNPHFLYNTLSSITIMASEGKSDGVVKMCTDLSKMLRYISSESIAPVLLGDEMKHTVNYTNIMKIRYGKKINFNINVPCTMLDIKIPKLTIQPLVENCIKYGLSSESPWDISVTGWLEENMWYVEVRDNGAGFEADMPSKILGKLQMIDLNDSLPSLNLDGMGLANIYIRLCHFYGDNAIFSLYNNNGAVVKIGGIISIGGNLNGR